MLTCKSGCAFKTITRRQRAKNRKFAVDVVNVLVAEGLDNYVLMILLGANLCSDDVATSPSRPAGIQGGGGVARYASCRGRSEWHCGLWLGASRNVASALLHVCGNLHRDYTEEHDRFPIKVFYNVGRVAMPVQDWSVGRCGCFSTCAV